jgi:hypothetical protein
MVDIAKLRNSLRKSIGFLLGCNVLITVAGIAYIAWDLSVPYYTAHATEILQNILPEPEDAKSFSSAEITQLTRGKAVFRTSRARKPRVVNELSYFQLKGISTRDGLVKAYMRNRKLKKMETKRIGDMVGPFEIIGISKEGVTLRRGNEEVLLPKG